MAIARSRYTPAPRRAHATCLFLEHRPQPQQRRGLQELFNKLSTMLGTGPVSNFAPKHLYGRAAVHLNHPPELRCTRFLAMLLNLPTN